MDERLVQAARVGDVYTLLKLLDADPEILERASLAHFTDSALHVAALYGNANFVEQIVTRMPSLATETNQKGMIPLHLASSKGYVETVRELLKAKLDDDDGVNQCLVKDDDGWNPLHCASLKGKIMVMEELIRECPECLEQVTAKGETVLHLAVKANQFEAVELLADIIRHHNFQRVFKAQDQKGKSAYQLAAAKKLQSQVLELLKEDDEEDDGISVDIINVESESDSLEGEGSNKSHLFQGAVLVVAILIITLTYQAMANPPSTFLKEGSTKIEWGCLNLRRSPPPPQGLIKRLKECPAISALLFMIFNTSVFNSSILLVIITQRGRSGLLARLLMLLLVLCYSCLLMAFCYYAVYYALPLAFAALALFCWSYVRGFKM